MAFDPKKTAQDYYLAYEFSIHEIYKLEKEMQDEAESAPQRGMRKHFCKFFTMKLNKLRERIEFESSKIRYQVVD